MVSFTRLPDAGSSRRRLQIRWEREREREGGGDGVRGVSKKREHELMWSC